MLVDLRAEAGRDDLAALYPRDRAQAEGGNTTRVARVVAEELLVARKAVRDVPHACI